MYTTFEKGQFEELLLVNLFSNLTPFIPETPVLRAQEYQEEVYFKEM